MYLRDNLIFLKFLKAVFEPHNIRQQYWKFLVRVSCHKFQDINRDLLDVFGTNATTINRMMEAGKVLKPIYDAKLSDINSHLRI